jgi:hypothetical protein
MPNPKQIFKQVLRAPQIKVTYNLTEPQIDSYELNKSSNKEVVEVLRQLINGITNQMPDSSIYNSIKKQLKVD